jgi:hypothetical protein
MPNDQQNQIKSIGYDLAKKVYSPKKVALFWWDRI